MFDLAPIQQSLRELGLDGWLLYDFRSSNVLAQRVLGIAPENAGTRRIFCLIPASGAPRTLVHRIESGALDHIGGEKTVYLRWQELEAGVGSLVAGLKKIAMEYSPRNANPYISRVDAGTLELVRSFGVEVVSSGDLIQLFEAAWSDAQWQAHLDAEKHTVSAFDAAWKFIADNVRSSGSVTEKEVEKVILDHFAKHDLTTYHPPIVAVGPNSGDPHYETGAGSTIEIRENDFVLIDLWARLDNADGVYSDLTRVGYVGRSVPAKFNNIFAIVAAARDAAIERVRTAFATGESISGWQVDRVTRDVIDRAGYGDKFVHRTGHSIGRETHGNGANIDDLETHDERRILPRTCFSIEPGIYLDEFGIRSEVNVFIDARKNVHVTGGPLQTEVLPILAEF
ncbi:MAG: M24 family metallopeptidase [Planctomycetaceae bacterium]